MDLRIWDKQYPVLRELEQVPQNPTYHGEGSVRTHTALVADALQQLPEYQELDPYRQEILLTAALLHDVGKIPTTRWEDGNWTSPHHSASGAAMVRQMLWQDRGLSGTVRDRSFREAVCTLVRYHGLPLHAALEDSGKTRLLAVASLGELIPEFSIRMLCMLAEADVLGRICADREELLERIGLCRLLAQELGCYALPYRFPTDHTRFSYLNNRYELPDYPLYDDTWGPVILMSGLPGTGKDTFIQNHYPDHPMISLDEIRQELGVSPEDSQMRVVDTANERAKVYLRRKEPFIWNATNLSPRIRQRIIGMMTDYKASVRIEFLETGWEEGLRRNEGRRNPVPQQAICRMLQELTPPGPWEAREVRWHCV